MIITVTEAEAIALRKELSFSIDGWEKLKNPEEDPLAPLACLQVLQSIIPQAGGEVELVPALAMFLFIYLQDAEEMGDLADKMEAIDPELCHRAFVITEYGQS